ncbi:hypothetical protein FKM82_012717 [Ascaphus truei]
MSPKCSLIPLFPFPSRGVLIPLKSVGWYLQKYDLMLGWPCYKKLTCYPKIKNCLLGKISPGYSKPHQEQKKWCSNTTP